MRVRAEKILTSKKEIKYKKIFVTGSDEVLIDYVSNYLIKNFRDRNFYIDSSNQINQTIGGDLFSDKKVLFYINNISTNTFLLKNLNLLDQAVLFSSPNNKKNNKLKTEFLKLEDAVVVECYSLNRATKEMVVKNLIEEEELNISKSVFWYIVESLDDCYVILKKQIQTLSFLKNKPISIESVGEVLFVEKKIELNKMFFYILKDNETLINIFNKNIFSLSDFYIFLNSTKQYLKIIHESSNKEDALFRFPKYLFNEKETFLKIYNSVKRKNLIKIYSNIFRVESLIRKNPVLYSAIGLRFFINTKKIIIS